MVLARKSDGGARQRRARTLGKKSEPVPEDRCRRGSGGDILPKRAVRKLGAQGGPACNARPFLEACKPLFGLGVEIADREGRIGMPLAREKPGNIAHIFAFQRKSVIFGMPLKKDKSAAQLLGEDIDAGLV